MKKLSAMLIAISFCILSAGSALANDSQMDTLDRHAVWSNWFDENGNRIQKTLPDMDNISQTASTESGKVKGMERTGEFSFIQETKSYDHAKDKGSSA